ncbi:MAG TPA: hypothetical protein VNQ33_04110 [Acidimicrobiales bacterium]|nr:hypothetical protein [Acidimicrobiales bacterium]
MDWPTEPLPADEPTRPRSQAAVYVVCALAMVIVCSAAETPTLGLGCSLALAVGVGITLAAGLRRPFGGVPGAVVALIAMMAMAMLLAFTGGPPSAWMLVPVVGAFVLGFDWHLVRRLRPLPFAFGFLVVLGLASGDRWTYPVGVLWLALALGALTSLESDRRAAQPKVRAVSVGPEAPDVQATDLVTTVLVALAIALVAALVLSTPSCQPTDSSDLGPSGSRSPYGTGSGSGLGSGSESGSGAGSGRTYVPDDDGRFLVPDDGSGSGSTSDIPSPDLLPAPGESRRLLGDDGTTMFTQRGEDGAGAITVTDPDGTSRTYTYREQPDGTTRIQELDDDGRPGRTLTYDPKGQIATGGSGSDAGSGSAFDQQDREQEKEDDKPPSHLDWRLLLGLVLLLAAGGALAWWWSKRPPEAPPVAAPPWALRLAREIDREGAARGPRRDRSQSLVRYADDLRAGPIPDDRVIEVAVTVSAALFGRHDPGPETQARAESTWAAVVEAHPAPGRAERRRARAGTPTA